MQLQFATPGNWHETERIFLMFVNSERRCLRRVILSDQSHCLREIVYRRLFADQIKKRLIFLMDKVDDTFNLSMLTVQYRFHLCALRSCFQSIG